MTNYRRDFLALVEQNDRITRMTAEMEQAVSEITRVVRERVEAANRDMAQKSAEIEATSERQERLMLAMVATALLLGVLFAFLITVRIVRPLRTMAGILDQLAHQETSERLPYYPNGRDEVNEMAGSVNLMAENRSRFIGWWQNAMREANACEALELALQAPEQAAERQLATEELRAALAARHELLFQQFHKLHRLNGNIMQQADALSSSGHLGRSESHVEAIQYASRSVQNILEMVAYQESHGRTTVDEKAVD
jgi:methyl-accepting chemotaxis protein